MLIQNIPYLPRGNGNINMPDANMRQSINYGIGNSLWSANRRRLTYSLGPNGMVGGRCHSFIRLPMWRLHRSGDQVVLEVAARDIAVLIERYFFVHGWSKSLGQSAVN